MTSLGDLLDQAERAAPGARIELRAQVAAHGTEALPALTAWLATDRLGFFSARVIEEIAKSHRQAALSALRDARKYASANVRREIDDILYRNGAGIVGIGQAVGPVRKRPYQGKAEHPDEEFYRDLDPFQHVVPPASAGEIKDVTSRTYSFRGTLFTMGAEEGERLLMHLTGGSDR